MQLWQAPLQLIQVLILLVAKLNSSYYLPVKHLHSDFFTHRNKFVIMLDLKKST